MVLRPRLRLVETPSGASVGGGLPALMRQARQKGNTVKEWETLTVCGDCLMAAANGITDPYAVWGDGFPERWQAANARHGSELVAACSDETHPTGCVRDGFSWNACDWCGDTLGGDRFCASVAVES